MNKRLTIFALALIFAGCTSMNPTARLVTNLAVKGIIVAAVSSQPELIPILNTAADAFLNPAGALSPGAVKQLAIEEINKRSWEPQWKAVALTSIDDVILVYEDFYNQYKDQLTQSDLQEILSRIGGAIKLGASISASGDGEIPPVTTESGMIVQIE